MSSFDERKKGFEKKFAHDQELQFKVSARRNKYIGQWASKILGYDEEKEKEYIQSVIKADFAEAGDEDVFRKIKEDLKNHEQKFDEDNLLTRGQTIANVPIEETDPVVLKAGQMSLHHPTVIHGSGLNRSNDRRIGFVVQSYIGSNVDQVLGRIYVQKARGEDTHKFHEYSNIPKGLMLKEDIKSWNKAKDELSKIFYSGATKKGKY